VIVLANIWLTAWREYTSLGCSSLDIKLFDGLCAMLQWLSSPGQGTLSQALGRRGPHPYPTPSRPMGTGAFPWMSALVAFGCILSGTMKVRCGARITP
jgi:hypothetical protein